MSNDGQLVLTSNGVFPSVIYDIYIGAENMDITLSRNHGTVRIEALDAEMTKRLGYKYFHFVISMTDSQFAQMMERHTAPGIT